MFFKFFFKLLYVNRSYHIQPYPRAVIEENHLEENLATLGSQALNLGVSYSSTQDYTTSVIPFSLLNMN